MGTISIDLPDELEKSMHEFKLDWEDVAIRAFLDKTEKLKKLKRISSKINLSDKDAKLLADKINLSVYKRFKEGR